MLADRPVIGAANADADETDPAAATAIGIDAAIAGVEAAGVIRLTATANIAVADIGGLAWTGVAAAANGFSGTAFFVRAASDV